MAPIENSRNEQTGKKQLAGLTRIERFLARNEKSHVVDCSKVIAMHHLKPSKHKNNNRPETCMNFLDGSLHPENQQKLVITVAPYAPEWMPSDFPEDIP